jgi:hypothetical protein
MHYDTIAIFFFGFLSLFISIALHNILTDRGGGGPVTCFFFSYSFQSNRICQLIARILWTLCALGFSCFIPIPVWFHARNTTHAGAMYVHFPPDNAPPPRQINIVVLWELAEIEGGVDLKKRVESGTVTRA